MIDVQEIPQEEEPVRQLKLLQGGKGGPGGGENKDWLSGLPEGTIFVAEEKGTVNFICPQFQIDYIFFKAIRLLSFIDNSYFWTTGERFSRRFTLVEVLATKNNNEEKEEE